MKAYRVIFILLCLWSIALPARASHIVGGEFELVHIEGNRYKLSLILYSDDINIVDPAAIDPFAMVHIWSKATNSRINSITLPKVSQTKVPYTNPACAIPQLRTSKVIYSAEVTLSPETFNNPEGYYLNYERCCRNGVINNIVRPGETGEAFYLEFPAVVKDGKPFINSSPRLFPPLSDFARLGYPFYFDFRGTDADGDSLVYSLATPLAGFSSPDSGNVLPPPRSAPYPKVQWASGFGQANMVPGNPALQISEDGLIRVTPSQTGLFVFSVLVEEYRKGEKIGEVRRDFQMLVYDYEGSDHPPVLKARKNSNGLFYEDAITLTEADFVNQEANRCVALEVSDQDVDAIGAAQNGRENLQFRIVPVNFSGASSEDYLSMTRGQVDKTDRSLLLHLCLPLCPPVENGPYIFDVVAYDDACALPLTDTLRVTVDLSEGPRNLQPQTTSSLSSTQTEQVNLFRTLGQAINFEVTGYDPDQDYLSLRAEGDGFQLETYGMEFTPKNGTGPLKSTFSWDPSCANVNLDDKNFFTIFFITEDEDLCQRDNGDTLTVNIGISAPPNSAPVLELLGARSPTLETHIDSSLVFELIARDPNTGDSLHLTLDSISADTTAGRLVYLWEDVAGGNELSSTLQIDPDCQLFANGATEYLATFHFRVKDNPCFTELSDTLSLKILFKERELNFEQVKFINVFTPNEDGVNDYFEILNLPESACFDRLEKISVFNRWGKVIFETLDPDFKWDGEGAPGGSYFYLIQYTKETFRRNLTIIRADKPGNALSAPQ